MEQTIELREDGPEKYLKNRIKEAMDDLKEKDPQLYELMVQGNFR